MSHPIQPARSFTDEALIRMLEMDDEWALKEIFERYHVRLFQAAAGVLHDEDLARDIVQDIFVALWTRRQSSDIQVLSCYLFKAVRYQVLKELRNGKLHDRHLKLLEKIQFANQTEESIDYAALEDMLQKVVDQLSPRCREIFVLSRFEYLTHKEISSRLNISTKTVEAQIGKALSFLRTRLQEIMVIGVLHLLF
jgi:RNA polymerase sigma-70 factor (ECF subfamily)